MTAATLGEALRISALMARDRLSGRKIVILFIEELGFIQFILPVYQELVRRRGGRISFYMASEYADRDDHLSVFDVPRSRRFHPRLARAFLLADVFLSASVYGKGPKTSARINISHNQPTKFEAYPKKYVENYNFHFLTGPLHREQYEHMLALHELSPSRYRLVDVGYPKSDALLQGKYDRAAVLTDLGLDPARKTILYAPAWDPGGSLRSFGERVVEQLLSIEDASVIVKLHPVSHTPPSSASYEFYTGGIDWKQRFSKYEANNRFRHVTDFQVDPLLVAADLLVTDFSSVALEFVGLDKPIIYLDCPEYFERTLKMPGYETDPDYVKNDPRANAGRHVGIVVESVDELAAAAVDALANPSLGSGGRRELASRLLYNPGRGAETAAMEILRILGI